jgi:hypothetical protein
MMASHFLPKPDVDYSLRRDGVLVVAVGKLGGPGWSSQNRFQKVVRGVRSSSVCHEVHTLDVTRDQDHLYAQAKIVRRRRWPSLSITGGASDAESNLPDSLV